MISIYLSIEREISDYYLLVSMPYVITSSACGQNLVICFQWREYKKTGRMSLGDHVREELCLQSRFSDLLCYCKMLCEQAPMTRNGGRPPTRSSWRSDPSVPQHGETDPSQQLAKWARKRVLLSGALKRAHGREPQRLWDNLCSLSNWLKWKLLSPVWLFETPWTIQSMEFSRPEYWSG